MLCFARECEGIMESLAPELLEELRATGRSAGIDWDSLLTLSITAPLDPGELPLGSCTVVAVTPDRSTREKPLIGRNFDFFHDVSAESAATYATYPGNGYAHLGNCDIWTGREDGINEAGLFVGQAAFFSPGLKPGVTFWFLVRMLLDRCATVKEGIALLEETPHCASWTYLLADARGDAAVVEPTVKGVSVRRPENGLLILTNHAVCPEWAGTESYVPPDSRIRYERLSDLLGSGIVDIEDIRHALGDHTGRICSHGEHFKGRRFGTLWSVVGSPGERCMEIAEGPPCSSVYREFRF